ncbi:CATRA system-associated protein [Streptomyces sp. NPDC018019]|uniref:CATRA system-associated protein n=1 Tax=Streptomyces sp. NPDC018019 TaxID=3365030 RepID=UPI0037AD6579
MEQGTVRMAMGILEDVSVWRLKRADWDVVGRALADVQRALAAGDLSGVRRALADVEMAGPHRISGLEDCGLLPLPEEHRERVNELIHTLGATPPENPRTMGGAAPGSGDAADRDA